MGSGVAAWPVRSLAFGAVLSGVLVATLVGHVIGFWEIPRLPEFGFSRPIPGAAFNPHSISVAYATLRSADGASPWPRAATDQIMLRFAQRWSEATLGRSSLVVMDETDLRDVLVVFNNKTVVPEAGARYISFGGGRLRYIEVFAPDVFGVDPEFTAGTLLHETGHVLGCCVGPGTSGGHWINCSRQQILCAIHGNARTFTEEELAQMGLGR